MDELLAEFLAETNENLLELETTLVRFETASPDDATLSAIFRLVHTVKGTCGFLGLSRLERIAHATENALGTMRDGVVAPSSEIVSSVLEAFDRLKSILAGLAATGTEPAGDDVALISALTMAGCDTSTEPADVMPVAKPVANPAADAEPAAAAGRETVRVSVDLLETLMASVRELVLTRNQLARLSRGLDDNPIQIPLQLLSRITSELQEGVVKARMQPIGSAWRKLPRLVRDLARDLGKQIELVLHGAETELDRQILELIRDPLVHMVRNAADHGLEAPAERRACGKPETGRITLGARHEGGHVVIEIADDGRGLSIEKIRRKAIANGIATENRIAHMAESQIRRFIFHPGFSTASAVTAVSGRGVGMDVVKTNVERLGGTIDVNSTAGTGTSLTIRIPLTLAIISALLVEAAGERFAIPQVSIIELVAAGANGTTNVAIECVDDARMLRLRRTLIPLISLADLLRLEPAAPASDDPVIVITQVGAALLGLAVDRVFDIEEIVVKPTAPILHHVTVFGGSTILGDGEVIMILDPNGIARASGIDIGETAAPFRTDAAEQRGNIAAIPMLLFRAGEHGVMAVPIDSVTRIEQLAGNAIERCGDLFVTQCRDRLMPLAFISADAGDAPEFPGNSGEAMLCARPPHQSAGPNARARWGPDRARYTGNLSESGYIDQMRPVLVIARSGQTIGLVVDEIIDLVEDHLEIELNAARSGVIGTAVVGGRAADILDTGFWLARAWPDVPLRSEPVHDARSILAAGV